MDLSPTIFERGLFPPLAPAGEPAPLLPDFYHMLPHSPVSQGQLVEELKGQETSHGGT